MLVFMIWVSLRQRRTDLFVEARHPDWDVQTDLHLCPASQEENCIFIHLKLNNYLQEKYIYKLNQMKY